MRSQVENTAEQLRKARKLKRCNACSRCWFSSSQRKSIFIPQASVTSQQAYLLPTAWCHKACLAAAACAASAVSAPSGDFAIPSRTTWAAGCRARRRPKAGRCCRPRRLRSFEGVCRESKERYETRTSKDTFCAFDRIIASRRRIRAALLETYHRKPSTAHACAFFQFLKENKKPPRSKRRSNIPRTLLRTQLRVPGQGAGGDKRQVCLARVAMHCRWTLRQLRCLISS